MLVITRKPGESFGIGDSVVHVLSSRRGAIRIGIEAPKHVPIYRDDAGPRKPRLPGEVDEIRTPEDQRVTFPPDIAPIGTS